MSVKRAFFDEHVVNTIRMALLIIIVFSMLSFAHYHMNLKVFRQNTTETTLQRTTNYISRTLQDVNETYAYSSQTLAELYRYKIQQGYVVDEILADLKQKAQSLSVKTIGLVDVRNQLYFDSYGRVLSLDITSERDIWVQKFLDMPQDSRYQFYDPDSQEYEMLYSFYYDYKIKADDGEVIGILGVGIDYTEYYRRVQGLDDNIDVAFLTPKGELRLPESLKGESVFTRFPYLDKSLLLTAEKQDQIFWEHRNGENFLLYFRYLEDINRILALKMDFTDYYNQSKKEHFYSFLLGLVLTFVVVIVNLWISLYQGGKLKHTAFYDSLTRCRNRHYLENSIIKSSYWQQIRHSQFSMILFDIDYFKLINDTSGHLEGDRVLQQVAQIVRGCLRDSDEFIRWGGDEFIVLLDMDAQNALKVADRIRMAVDKQTVISLSLGITNIAEADSFKTVMDRADSALYDAKESGRNQVKAHWLFDE
ncbi:sensor domain-containing diguanylate cyclase [Vibrio fluminensis]|uniref:sensor domain-containing diguanylate cyclase n=1 Tax=Vibrio fluminensis TaxID=2783614 RepID=UPI0018890E00|nr:sensor domain-containing diguanylate cyclase [Vibrio fluminensis]